MNKKETTKMIPELRFPEFANDEGWKVEALGDIFSERHETGFIDLPLLSLTEKDGIIYQEGTNRKNNSSSDKSKYLRICPGDVAYNTMRMWEGRSAYVSMEGLVSPAYTVCKPNNGNNGLFFSYYFKTHQLIQQFHRFSQGLVKDTLNLKYEAFSHILVSKPTPEEQQKIADCLSSLDEVIAAQTGKLEVLKAHKKSLMQNLFPQEGEKIPKWRFPEFVNDEEWNVELLGGKDVSCFVNEKVSLMELKLDTYISTENILPDYGGVVISAKLPPAGSFNRFKKGDILISNIRPYLKKIWLADKNGASSNDVLVIRAGLAVTNWFLSFLLKNDSFINYVMKGAKGLKMPRGDKSLMEKYPIAFPQENEQQRIVECLSSLDALVAVQTQKIEQLKLHKKGLMQALFPGTNE